MPAVLPLMRAASRSSTRRRSSTPRKRREAPSIPAAGQNVACKSPAVRICVEELLIFGLAHAVASGSSATRKLSFAGASYYSGLSVQLLCMKPCSRTRSSTPAHQAGAPLNLPARWKGVMETTARRQTKATLSLIYEGINGPRLSNIARIGRTCFLTRFIFNWLVDVTGIEPVTPCLQS